MQLQRKQGFYEKYIKRLVDIVGSVIAIVFFSWLYVIIALAVRLKLGSPIIFKQPRPGMIDPSTGKEKIFNMYKFRTMTDERDARGNLLPDEERLGSFGKKLRASSFDELPEIFNILKGDMTIIGPRPQLVRDMVFMSDTIRMRHTAKPGLSGLAQMKGRNAITWEKKFFWDLEYIKNISITTDASIFCESFKKVFLRIDVADSSEETDITLDYGDALLKSGKISKQQYDEGQKLAKKLIVEHFEKRY